MSLKKETNSPVAKRIRSARVAKGLSQKKLGILAGIDEFSVSPRINQYEKGKHAPDFSTAQRLAGILSIPVAYLYAVDDDLAEMILLFYKGSNEQKAQAKNIFN